MFISFKYSDFIQLIQNKLVRPRKKMCDATNEYLKQTVRKEGKCRYREK